MKIKKRIQAVMLWVSEKLPCSHPQFQIIYGADEERKEEA